MITSSKYSFNFSSSTFTSLVSVEGKVKKMYMTNTESKPKREIVLKWERKRDRKNELKETVKWKGIKQ